MVEYRLVPDGLLVTHTAVNSSVRAAPWALGVHPFVRAGDLDVDRLRLTVPASRVVETDDAMIPVRTVPAEESLVPGADLRQGEPLAGLDLDTGFTGLARGADGRAESTLLDDQGRGVAIWQDERFDHAVVFTPRDLPGLDGPRHVVAVEPMSAPADALNSGVGLVWLEPGESWTGQWGIRAVGL